MVLLAIARYACGLNKADTHLLEFVTSSESRGESFRLFVVSAAEAGAMLRVATLPIKKAAAIRFRTAVFGASALRYSCHLGFVIIYDARLSYRARIRWQWRRCRIREGMQRCSMCRQGCTSLQTAAQWYRGWLHHPHRWRCLNGTKQWLLLR